MKSLRSLSVLTAALVLSCPVLAQVSATKDVVVDASLTGACVFDDAIAVNLTAVYPAFSTLAVEPEETIAVRCTRQTATPVVSFGGGSLGVVGGLFFQLSAVWTQTAAGSEPTGALNNFGVARAGEFLVKASFPAGQAGTVGATTPVVKEMTLTF